MSNAATDVAKHKNNECQMVRCHSANYTPGPCHARGWTSPCKRPLAGLARGVRLVRLDHKGARWMSWRREAMKDVVTCEKLRGAGKQAEIRRCPNGATHPFWDTQP